MTKRIFKFLLLSLSLLLTVITLSSATVTADDSETRTLTGDFFNKVFDVKLDSGKSFYETEEDEKAREEINNKAYKESLDKNYSLYDRFGGHILFVPYFGETKIITGLLDRFYSEYANNNGDFQLKKEDILKLFEISAVSNNIVYDGRPDILSTEDIESGDKDPRVATYIGVHPRGGEAHLGNFYLTISSGVSKLIGWATGSGLYKTVSGVWDKALGSGLGKLLKWGIGFILPMGMVFWIISIMFTGNKILRGRASARKLGTDLLGALFSLSLIYALASNPTAFSSLLTTGVSLWDQTLDKALQVGTSEVVKSDDTKHVREAMLWKKTTLDPWAKGMFGRDYEHMYTLYEDSVSQDKKLPQSDDDVLSPWDDGSKKYNSKEITGDAFVEIGPNKKVRNWAALAWSTQSIYHIDAVLGKDKEDAKKEVKAEGKDRDDSINTWPRAKTTPLNNNIYVDSFRWVDALLDISPEYLNNNVKILNYTKARNYETNFIAAGLESLYMTFLLLPIGLLGFKKIRVSVIVASSVVRLLYYSVMNYYKKYIAVYSLKLLFTFYFFSCNIFSKPFICNLLKRTLSI